MSEIVGLNNPNINRTHQLRVHELLLGHTGERTVDKEGQLHTKEQSTGLFEWTGENMQHATCCRWRSILLALHFLTLTHVQRARQDLLYFLLHLLKEFLDSCCIGSQVTLSHAALASHVHYSLITITCKIDSSETGNWAHFKGLPGAQDGSVAAYLSGG
jgi:hypothetical protein